MTAYRVLAGLDYAGKRAEVGDIVSDLPSKSITWLESQGIIEKASEKPSQPEPKPATPKSRERQSPSAKEDD